MPSTAHGAERPADPGRSNELPPLHGNAAAGVTIPVRVAAAWSWRLIIVVAAFTVSPVLEAAKWVERRGWFGKLQ